MEANDVGGGGGLFSGMASSAMLGLELPIQHHHQHQQQQNPNHHVAAFDSQHGGGGYTFPAASKPPASEEDEEGVSGDGKRKISQWQRMKWTDTMVRLLIMAVFYIGDETVPESSDHVTKKKFPGSIGGAMQKKGKWKSVSRAMLEKGFYVSPQQCEDKFNDLNKRYKRVNDILGKGTACKVVENQTLLDSMELNPRTKQEVRKLLNSKHLFFREMCAYHNSCSHSNPPGGGAHTSPGDQDPAPPAAQHHQLKQGEFSQPHHFKMLCVHPKPGKKIGSDEDDLDGDENDESEDEEDDDVAEDHNEEHDDEDEFEEEDNYEEGRPRKRPKRKGERGLVERLSGEVAGVVGDKTRSVWEVKRWLRARAVELEEEGVGFQYEALELEKQRLKWAKFSSKKEREMERARFESEKRRLENERMVLIVRQKELELLTRNNNNNNNNNNQNQQQHSCSKTG